MKKIFKDAIKLAVRRDGNVLIEYALIAPILLLILAALFDFGMAVYDSMSLKEAARSGAQYARKYPSNVAGITQVVANATGIDPQNLTVTTNLSCQCQDGSAAVCGTTCAAGPTETYVTVAVQEPYATLLPYPASVAPLTLQGAATLRIQ